MRYRARSTYARRGRIPVSASGLTNYTGNARSFPSPQNILERILNTPIDLPGLLASQRKEILERWMQRISREHDEKGLSRAELRDHLPTFFDQVISALAVQDSHSDQEASSGGPACAAHGTQRLRVGFDLIEVVREYEILSECILEEVEAVGGTVSISAFRHLQRLVNAGRAEAISAYVERRDEEAARAHAQHIAFVAHELRNPLAPSIMALSALRKNARPEDEWALSLLMRNLTSLRDLIDQVLIADRLDGRVQLKREAVDLRLFIDEAVTAASPAAKQRQLSIVVEAAPTLPFFGDARVLRSAIVNLLGNAVKFTQEGQMITVRATHRESTVAIEIEDRCGGLPEGNPQDLFRPYLQRGENQSGFGLGLAIVQQGITAHGGRVSVVNLPGKGCVFSLVLPDADPLA